MGLDANWHVENLWGTRDLQATTGLAGTGKYQTAMTLPREAKNKILPPDSLLTGSEAHSCYRLVPARAFMRLDSNLQKKAGNDNAFLSDETRKLLRDLYGAALGDDDMEKYERLRMWTREMVTQRPSRAGSYAVWLSKERGYDPGFSIAFLVPGFAQFPFSEVSLPQSPHWRESLFQQIFRRACALAAGASSRISDFLSERSAVFKRRIAATDTTRKRAKL
jgi:hypothetical protein